MGKASCCIPGCYPLMEHSRHRFANPKKRLELFQQWLRIINNSSLETLSNERIYSSYRVCEKHFVPDDFGPNRTLKKTAYPKLFLSVSQTTSSSNSNIYDGSCSDGEYHTAICKNAYEDPSQASETPLSDNLDLDASLWPNDEYQSALDRFTNDDLSQSGAISSSIEVSVEDHSPLKRRFLLNKAKRLFKSVLKAKRNIKTFKNARRKYSNCIKCEFDLQDKLSCLKLFKLNSSRYRMLQTVCALPHTKILDEFFQQLVFNTENFRSICST